MNENWIETIWNIIDEKGINSLNSESLIDKNPQDAFEIYNQLTSTQECLVYLWKFIDNEVLKNIDSSLEGREALFDLIMCYFEFLAPQKNIVGKLVNQLYQSPTLFFSLHKQAMYWAENVFQTCHLTYPSYLYIPSRYCFITLFAVCVKQWLEDETNDMNKTMAFIDDILEKTEALVSYLPNKL